MYYHVILMRFAPAVTAQQAEHALHALGQLRTQIPQILSYSYGPNDPANPHQRGFGHGFVMGFAGRAERDAYQQHPAHLDFIGTCLEPLLEDAAVFDFDDLGGRA
ncbi:Dabb family protein [Massilia sp. YMA4]|uniref:Dabb family protein n=1 Tax=[Empedobacter] haloabium TaxID=592317 RepID=A0ABZ1UNN7_9BURK|nr:Dabb family protein [Massilia sp. YMA4]AXA92280.1 hypothetical protein DPH57_14695 [Massilia sp. YMA4]